MPVLLALYRLEKSPGVIELETNRARACYEALESLVPDFGDAMHMGLLTAIAALAYADWRAADDNWRNDHPNLAAWNEAQQSRPSVADTKPNV